MTAPLYPITSAWYDGLPVHKLEAFPGCLAHARLPRLIEAAYPTLAKLPHLPRPWRMALAGPGFAPDWVPETRLVLQYLLLRDAFFDDDETFLQEAKERIKGSFSSPLMRPLMAVMSPHLLILGAATRWSQYHRGTRLQASSKSMRTLEGSLHFPPSLYPSLMLADTQVAVQASIEMTGKVARVEAKLKEPGICALAGSWE